MNLQLIWFKAGAHLVLAIRKWHVPLSAPLIHSGPVGKGTTVVTNIVDRGIVEVVPSSTVVKRTTLVTSEGLCTSVVADLGITVDVSASDGASLVASIVWTLLTPASSRPCDCRVPKRPGGYDIALANVTVACGAADNSYGMHWIAGGLLYVGMYVGAK